MYVYFWLKMRYAGVHLGCSSLAHQLEASRGRCGSDLWETSRGERFFFYFFSLYLVVGVKVVEIKKKEGERVCVCVCVCLCVYSSEIFLQMLRSFISAVYTATVYWFSSGLTNSHPLLPVHLIYSSKN